MSILSRIFRRYPRYEVSGYRDLYSAVVARLTRTGVHVGGTAGYPRVEVHSIREQERLDKEGALRQMTLTIESMSDTSLGEAVTMNEDNLRLLTETEIELTGWNTLGVVSGQLQDLTETTDSKKIIYRLLQEVSVYLEKIKSDTPPPEPEATGNENS